MQFMKTRLPMRIVLPSLLAGAILGSIYATMLWATRQSDQMSIARQERLVDVTVGKQQAAIAHDQESATVWDDAVRKVAARDQEWIDANLGRWMQTYFGHDGAFVLDASGSPIFSYLSDAPGAAEAFSKVDTYVVPLAEKLRQRLARGDEQGKTEQTLSIGESEIVAISGRPAILSAKPVLSDTGDLAQVKGTEAIHIALRYLDGDFAQTMGAEYLFADMRYERSKGGHAERLYYPIKSTAGDPLGFFSWTPFRPGTRALRQTEPVFVAGALLLLAVVSGFALVLHKRSERLMDSQSRLFHLAHFDSLTGLPNRASFTAEVSRRLAAGQAAVLFLDLDRFKQVNDTLGHPTGDKLIAEVAKRLSAVAGVDVFLARIGGDEFTAVAPAEQRDAVEALAEKLIGTIRQPFEIDGQPILIGLTIGIAFAEPAASDAQAIVRQADIALYHAKAAGRNRYAIFGQHMEGLISARRALEQDLRTALLEGRQIEVHYQPVYLAGDNRMISVEALARWRHPAKGMICPDVFIPIAEEAGLIDRLGDLVLQAALHAAKRWPDLGLAVNASPIELRHDNYALRVTAALNRHAFDPRRLEIEITESAVIDDDGTCRRNIEALRRLGVRFALDDFGTGFSSFGRLQALDVDRIKIDKCFIDQMGDAGSNEAIVHAIVDLAHARGLKTTAEGIETACQSRRLAELGCDEIQGYFLSRPVESAGIDAMVKTPALEGSDMARLTGLA